VALGTLDRFVAKLLAMTRNPRAGASART